MAPKTPRAWLRQMFARERAQYAREYPHLARVPLRIVRAPCGPGKGRSCPWRSVAWAIVEGDRSVSILERALSLPRANLTALVRHELGHLADDRPFAAWSEQRADDIAERVTGEKIRYDADDLQTVGPGRYPRPLNLHR